MKDKKCKVILLLTENNTKIGRDNYTGNLMYCQDEPKCLIGYHICIIEINGKHKDGDYVLDVIDKRYEKFGEESCITKDHHLIIATTNPDLIKEGIASIDDKWLQEYCKNPVDEVLVEYEEYTPGIDDSGYGFPIGDTIIEPKLSSNGSIIIKSVVKDHDILSKLKEYFLNTPREQVLKDWEEAKKNAPKGKKS